MTEQQKARLLNEAAALHARYLLHETVTPTYFEPGQMEYLEQTDGHWDEASGTLTLRFEVKGTRYGDRTERIERMTVGEPLCVKRDAQNTYNANNFKLLTAEGADVGTVPATLCDAMAPLYDSGALTVVRAAVSFAEPISKRSRHAKQAMLFAELVLQLAV